MCAVSVLIACAAPMRAISNRSKRGTKKLSMVCPWERCRNLPEAALRKMTQVSLI